MLFVVGATLPPSAMAQKASVKPGINKSFEDANVEAFVKRFETESREAYRYRCAIVAATGVEPGMEVADIGAGTGLFTRMFSDQLAENGRVYAVDISNNFLDHIRREREKAGRSNVVPVHCDQHSTALEEGSIDLAFVCDTYHHFEFPQDTLASIHRALRPDGTLFVIDFRRIQGVTRSWILGHVRCGKGTVTDEIKDAGFELVAEIPLMKEQYVLKFKKRPADTGKKAGEN